MDSGFEQNKFDIYSRDIISYRDCSEKKILDSFGKFFLTDYISFHKFTLNKRYLSNNC